MLARDARAKWADALRSGAYIQDRENIAFIHCTPSVWHALGVCCNIYRATEGGVWTHFDSYDRPSFAEFFAVAQYPTEWHCLTVPELVLQWVELTHAQEVRICEMTGEGKTFEEIASYIEGL